MLYKHCSHYLNEADKQLNGFRDALKKYGLSEKSCIMVEKEIERIDDLLHVQDVMEEILKCKRQFDSIIIPSLVRSSSIYLSELLKRDRNIFKNVKVGILVIDENDCNYYPFSTIALEVNDYNIGVEAAKIMISRLEGKSLSMPQNILARARENRNVSAESIYARS